METSEILHAASSVAKKAPEERDSFIKETYQTANIVEIELIKRYAEKYDEHANNLRESEAMK